MYSSGMTTYGFTKDLTDHCAVGLGPTLDPGTDTCCRWCWLQKVQMVLADPTLLTFPASLRYAIGIALAVLPSPLRRQCHWQLALHQLCRRSGHQLSVPAKGTWSPQLPFGCVPAYVLCDPECLGPNCGNLHVNFPIVRHVP